MPKNILIADDDPALINIYTRLFTGTDYLISKASSFAEAAGLINSNNYDLLVTDMMFPDGIGTDLIILFERKQGSLKCILVTGSGTEINLKQIPPLAAYFEKPLNTEAFMAAVTKALL